MFDTARPSGIPILGALAPIGRTILVVTVVTVVASVAALAMDFGLHADPTLVFVVSGAAILGLAWVVGLVDGESNWLEGALLVLVYAILGVSFFEFN